MPEMTVAQTMAVAPAATAGGTPAGAAEASPGAVTGPDFATVLKSQLGQHGAEGAGADAAAILLADDADAGANAGEAGPAAPDLAALLPALAALVQPAAGSAVTMTAPAAEAVPAASLPAASASLPAASARPQPATLAVAAGRADEREIPLENNGLTAARQPAVFAVAAQATAETAATARLSSEWTLPEQASAVAEAATSAAHGAARAEHGAPARAAQAAMHVETPVGARGWDADMGQKLVWLAGREESRAELTLTPPHLGKVEVTISVSGDQTNALFVSASPAAREALEQALPRLREILADAGITLGQASVNAESPRRGEGEGREGGREERDGPRVAGAPVTGAAGPWVRQGNGLIDTFA